MLLGLGNFISGRHVVLRGADTSGFLCLCKLHWTVVFCKQKTGASGRSLQDLHLVVMVFPVNGLLPSVKQKWKWGLGDIESLQQWGGMAWSSVPVLTSNSCLRLSQHVAPPAPRGTDLMGTTFHERSCLPWAELCLVLQSSPLGCCLPTASGKLSCSLYSHIDWANSMVLKWLSPLLCRSWSKAYSSMCKLCGLQFLLVIHSVSYSFSFVYLGANGKGCLQASEL